MTKNQARQDSCGLFGDYAPASDGQSPVVRNTPGLVRADAPDTSKQAARVVKTGTARMAVLRMIVDAGDKGVTDEQMQASMAANTQRPRRRELQTAGYIQPGGTRPTATGAKATIWIATTRGQRQAESSP